MEQIGVFSQKSLVIFYKYCNYKEMASKNVTVERLKIKLFSCKMFYKSLFYLQHLEIILLIQTIHNHSCADI